MTVISSFDVFDTVLVRKSGSPESSFLFLGRKLKKLDLIQITAESFALVRAEAERRAFENAGGLDSDVSLEQIYREVGHVLSLSVDQIERLQALERKLEIELLAPVPQALNLIQKARDNQHKVVFVSDMYLEPDFIKDRLVQLHIWHAEDKIYVSNTYRKSKLSGQLYYEVASREQAKRSQIIHCGNHPWSDVQSALKAGLRIQPFLEGNLNRYEQIMENYAWMSEGLSSAMAGASRLTRLSLSHASAKESALQDVAAGVAAPILVGFVLWILKRTQELGIKRLYFLARDGQILIAIAERLIQKLDLDYELTYLYGSRQAWLLPSMTVVDQEQLKRIFPLEYDVDYLSPRVLFARFCITPDEIRSSLEKIDISANDWDRNLNEAERQALHHHILSDPDIQQLILARAAEKRHALLQYLDQVHLTDDNNYCVIDLGTGATLHNALAAVLDTRNIAPPRSFYLGLRNVADSQYGLPEPYMYDQRYQLGFNHVSGLTTLLEMVCSADHGSVIDYQIRDNQVYPIFKEESNQAVLDWGYPIVRDTILHFADHLLLDASLLNPQADVRSMVATLQQAFWLTPTQNEARAWGTFPMEDGWGKESEFITLAAPYSLKDLPRLWWHAVKDIEILWRRHWWHGAAIQLTSPWMQGLFYNGQRTIFFLRKVFQKTLSTKLFAKKLTS